MSRIEIVCMQRGWITVAKVTECGDELFMRGRCLWRWLQTSLHEIADKGPNDSFDLEPGSAEEIVDKLAVVKRVVCNQEAWAKEAATW